MTKLTTAKSRTTARTETHVAYRGDTANPEWLGLSSTIAVADNSAEWGYVSAPRTLMLLATALSGSATSIGVTGDEADGFSTYAPSFIVGKTVRVFRPVNGQMQLVRQSEITAVALDRWSRLSSENVITGNSFEFQFPSFSELTGTYTFGVARIGADGRIGPVATTSIAVTGPTYTVLTPATPTTGGTRSITGRNGALAAVTGLTAQIRASTTHNIQLAWDAGAPNEFVVFINWNGTSDRLNTECALTVASGPAVMAGDMLMIDSDPILTTSPAHASRRVTGTSLHIVSAPRGAVFENIANASGAQQWEFVPYGGGFPKPDITYPDHFLRITGTPSSRPRSRNYFHAGTDQSFYTVLLPGRTYRAEFVVSASQATNATFSVEGATVVNPNVSLTTSAQTFTFDFTVPSIIKPVTARSWIFEAATNNVSLNLFSVRVWDTTTPHGQNSLPLPAKTDVRDHYMVRRGSSPVTLDAVTSRTGSGVTQGWTFQTLFQNCATFDCYPHIQIEWFYRDQYYSDLVTFWCAPASSGEPLALKREALGFGPIHQQFARWLIEDGNERWNPIMWAMFANATDAATAAVYGQGQLAAMFSARRRAIMMANPYWPSSNPPIEFAAGWLINPTYSAQVAGYEGATYTSVALYNSGWDVNRVFLADNAARWSDLLASANVNQQTQLTTLRNALAGTGIKLGTYEAGPGYQLSGLNGVSVTKQQEIDQEVVAKSIAGTTSMMSSVALAATLGYGPYNFFTWGTGGYWAAGRPLSEGGGFYRVAGFIKAMHDLLGRCRVYSTSKFIDRTRQVAINDTNGNFLRNENVPRAAIYHFESLDFPGRHGILYLNTSVNFDAFGAGHPDYQAGVTGAAEFRYHTGLPASAVPFKVLRNEGNMRHHDAYKVGFRPNVVGSAIDGYVADPLCVDLTVTPEDFTVTDPRLRTLTLLGGNCRLEVFTT